MKPSIPTSPYHNKQDRIPPQSVISGPFASQYFSRSVFESYCRTVCHDFCRALHDGGRAVADSNDRICSHRLSFSYHALCCKGPGIIHHFVVSCQFSAHEGLQACPDIPDSFLTVTVTCTHTLRSKERVLQPAVSLLKYTIFRNKNTENQFYQQVSYHIYYLLNLGCLLLSNLIVRYIILFRIFPIKIMLFTVLCFFLLCYNSVISLKDTHSAL